MLVMLLSWGALVLASDPWRSSAYGVCEKIDGGCAPKLKVDELLLEKTGGSRTFVVERMCVYDRAQAKWSMLDPFAQKPVTIRTVTRAVYSRNTDPTVVDLPIRTGLYWLSWKEDGHAVQTSVFAGPILCNDLSIGPAPTGMIAMCVPSANSGSALFVPDPQTQCGR